MLKPDRFTRAWMGNDRIKDLSRSQSIICFPGEIYESFAAVVFHFELFEV